MRQNRDIKTTIDTFALRQTLNNLDALVYITDMDTDEILLINEKMLQEFGEDMSVVGEKCWQVFQIGARERCSFCPKNLLSIDPNTPVVWDEQNTVTGKHYRNVDSVVHWVGGRAVHMQHSVEVATTDQEVYMNPNTNLINAEEGISRVMGNRALYRRLLRDTDISGLAAELNAALAKGDLPRAMFEAHRLKGVAANLSLTALGEAAAVLERLLTANANVSEAATKLRIVVTATLAAIEKYLEEN